MKAGTGARLPKHGRPRADVMRDLGAMKANDADWRRGRTGAYVFWAGDDILDVAKEAHDLYLSENGLSPKAFPSLGRMENEVLEMLGALLRRDDAVGSMTSGGTESILVAVKTARDFARSERGVERPEIVMPRSAHPAFNKAAHYLGMRPIRTDLTADFDADVDALAAALTDQTALIVASAPQYPHGVIDPVPRIAEIADERGICLHVDACVGGIFLPFLRRLRGDDAVTDFDFSLPGVTSISVDLHKFGFTAKGASAVLYRDQDIKKYQDFAFTDWPIGQYYSPTMTGTRPGGPIAAAWAVMNYLGEDGYLALVDKIMSFRERFIAGIESVPGFQVWGEPAMACLGYGSAELDMAAVASGMAGRGWFVNQQADPPGLHLFITPAHELAIDSYTEDLRAVAEDVRAGLIRADGKAAAYN